MTEKSDSITPPFDPVSRPSHYIAGRKFEPMQVILDWQLGYALGCVVKYIARADRKGSALEDLRKARAYLDAEIRHREEAAARE